MAFADPQSVNYNGTAYDLTRISSSENAGKFHAITSDPVDLTLSVSSQYGKRTRRLARLDIGYVNPNPFATGLSIAESSSVYLVIDTPASAGVIDPSVAVVFTDAFRGWMNTGNALLHLLQGQN